MALNNFVISGHQTELSLDDIHLSPQNEEAMHQLINEFKHFEVLSKYNLPIDNKILFHGHTGCGKTASAIAIAKELDKDVIIINLGEIVSSKLGETAKNIGKLFTKATLRKSVLFIDEFDSLGKVRDAENTDSGEMRRLVNSLIQMFDHLPEEALLICATNAIDIIDPALLRRFQVRLEFERPTLEQLDRYYDQFLQVFPEEFRNIERLYDISYAEAKDKIHRDIKRQVISLELSKV